LVVEAVAVVRLVVMVVPVAVVELVVLLFKKIYRYVDQQVIL
jgi:hypothetical protein